eukprot:c6116_g1_i1.p1 GENE.c6116_g1_i1~~c6116_g1_i1.p1  ORF type:complete len:1228 (-),score=282.65 c6116_g1_i1:13-3696(-)
METEMSLLVSLALAGGSTWELSFQLILRMLFDAVGDSEKIDSVDVCENVISPCLHVLVSLCKASQVNSNPIRPSRLMTFDMCGVPGESFEVWERRKDVLRNGDRDICLAFKYAQRWRRRIQLRNSKPNPFLMSPGWLVKLMLSESSQNVRSSATKLIVQLCSSNHQATLQFADLLTGNLKLALQYPRACPDFLAAYVKLLADELVQLYLVSKGVLETISQLITTLVGSLLAKENSQTPNHSEDLSHVMMLKTVVELFQTLMSVPTVVNNFRRSKGLLSSILAASVNLRGLVVQRTKLSEDCANILQSVLHQACLSNDEDAKQYVIACIGLINSVDEHHQLAVLDEVNSVLCPFKSEKVVLMTLTKSSTQEDFIRGSMTRNPYSSKDCGPLMRDVKNKICRDLELTGLLEDDNGMELLVKGQIIKLDLPVARVFEQVWIPYLRNNNADITDPPPMPITYRLAGLDGEATEPIIDSLSGEESQTLDPEVEFRLTSVMGECDGFPRLLNLVRSIVKLQAKQPLLAMCLRVLYHCCKIKSNRTKLARLNAVPMFVDKLAIAFSHESLAEIAEWLLLILEEVITEGNKQKEGPDAMDVEETEFANSPINEIDPNERVRQTRVFLEKLEPPLVRGHAKVAKTVSRILPYLTYGHPATSRLLIDHFTPLLNYRELDQLAKHQPEQLYGIEGFTQVALSIPIDSNGAALRQAILESGLTGRAVDYLMEGEKSVDIGTLMQRHCVRHVLPLLTGLSQRHPTTHEVVGRAVPLLHEIECVTSVTDIPVLAETLLDTIAEYESDVSKEIKRLRHATNERKREIALQHRQRALEEMGRRSGAIMSKIEDIEDETGLCCMVCREGYTLRPEELLCFYVNCKNVTLPPTDALKGMMEGSRNKGELGEDIGISISTHFNVIHLSCHMEATQAERSKRVPKEEWEGAAIRNSQVKCNDLFPAWGAKVADEVYSNGVSKFWGYLKNVLPQPLLAQADSSMKFRVLVRDLEMTLLKLAEGQEESAGRTNNAKLIPFNIQMGLFLLDSRVVTSSTSLLAPKTRGQGPSGQRNHFEHVLSSWLRMCHPQAAISSSSPTSPSLKGVAVHSNSYVLALSLYLMPLKQWNDVKFDVLKTILKNVFSSSANAPSQSPFARCRSMLLFFTLIDSLHKILKSTVPSESDSFEDNLRLHHMEILAALQTDLLQPYEDEWSQFESVEEFFDGLGLLGVVLSDNSSFESFLKSLQS